MGVRPASTGAVKMNIIYNSDNYYVVEYPAQHGFELVDKHTARSTFFRGDVAQKFAQAMQGAVNEDASVEHVDEFLGSFKVLLTVPVLYH
jgi:hypothetical protein